MKQLLSLTAVSALVGILGAAACSGCPPPEEASSSVPSGSQTRCGQGTVQRGNTCVAADRATSGSSGSSERALRGEGGGQRTLSTD